MPKQIDLFNDDIDDFLINIGDGDVTSITLGDTLYTCDDDFSITVTPDFNYNWSILDDTNNAITIGKHKISESLVEKIKALLDVIESLEDDHEVKKLFNTQLSMNKLRGENEDQSN